MIQTLTRPCAQLPARRTLAALGLALAPFLLHAPASAATTVFSEDFSAAVGDARGFPYGAGFGKGDDILGTQFIVTAGNVDVVGLPSGAPWACGHNPGGNCLDLQGATNTPSAIESKPSFDLLAGSTYTLTFGALLQGFAATDPALTTFTVSLGSFSRLLTSTGAGETFSLSYTPVANESSVRLGFASASFPDAYHGAVIDNILLTSTPGAVVPQVPEPGTYALMLAGLAAVGLVAGRRRRGG